MSLKYAEPGLKNEIHNLYVTIKAQNPGMSDEEAMEKAMRRARLVSAVRSQWMTLGEDGKPEWGLHPGIIDETLSLPTLAAELGIIEKAPEWATRAAERTSRLGTALNEETGLPAPEGFGEHLTEASGTMLAQLPVPTSALRSVARYLKPIARTLKGAPAAVRAPARAASKVMGPASEWFLPTIDPSAKNYAIGALFGGTLNTLGETDPEENDAMPVQKYGIGGLAGYFRRIKEEQSRAGAPDPNYTGGVTPVGRTPAVRTPGVGAPGAARFQPYRGDLKKYGAGPAHSFFADGGKVGALAHALKKLSGIFQGEVPTHTDTEDLRHGLKFVTGVPSAQREAVHRTNLVRKYGVKPTELEKASLLDDQMLNELAEIYFSDKVVPKAAGGRVPGGTQRAVKVIHEAIEHLKNGDSETAAKLIRSSPEAMAEPSIAEMFMGSD